MTDRARSAARFDVGWPADPMAVFHVGNLEVEGNRARCEQQLCAEFADHRGRIDLPAFAVLFDHLCGIPYYRTVGPCMQARLNISAIGYVAVDDRLTATAELQLHDDVTGVGAVRIASDTGLACCVGTARNVAVSRASATDELEMMVPIPDCARAQGIRLPEPIPTALSGARIVEEIAAGVRPAGPIVDLLCGRVDVPYLAGDTLRFIVETHPWMANTFGTMHGGVIGAIVGQAFSLAGQAHTAPGVDYRLADMSVGFFRSPSVHGAEVIVDVEAVKVGRRVASFTGRMIAHDGTLLAEGVADVHYG